jgi:hypothetical protein
MSLQSSAADATQAVPVVLPGTLRDRPPDQTWALVEPRLPRYGITRIAELTGLDTIGMPVYMAVRPLATTVGISQGKGATPLLARIAAVMEAIEICLIERFHPADTFVATAAELDLPYGTTELTPTWRSVVSDRYPPAVGSRGIARRRDANVRSAAVDRLRRCPRRPVATAHRVFLQRPGGRQQPRRGHRARPAGSDRAPLDRRHGGPRYGGDE